MKKQTEEELIELNVNQMLGELADLWVLVGIVNDGMNWEKRAKVFEGMIKKLSPKHAEYAEKNNAMTELAKIDKELLVSGIDLDVEQEEIDESGYEDFELD